jgi:hypothetical protein
LAVALPFAWRVRRRRSTRALDLSVTVLDHLRRHVADRFIEPVPEVTLDVLPVTLPRPRTQVLAGGKVCVQLRPQSACGRLPGFLRIAAGEHLGQDFLRTLPRSVGAEDVDACDRHAPVLATEALDPVLRYVGLHTGLA